MRGLSTYTPPLSVERFALGLPRALRDITYLLAVLAVALGGYALWAGTQSELLGFDFVGTLWDPASAIVDRRDPYPAPVTTEVEVGNPALYPPLLMLAIAPLTILPFSVGVWLCVAVLIGATCGALYALGVRDVRCYAFAFASLPVVSGYVLGNATLLLVPLVALAWKFRTRWFWSGAAIGVAIAAKLFLWPLLFWLLGTRRYRAAGVASVTAIAAVLFPWAVIGFDGLARYPDLLRVAEEFYAGHSYSVATMGSALGLDVNIATRVAVAIGVVLAISALMFGRSSRDELALSCALVGAMLGSPIVWEYYYVFVLVPIAITHPHFSWIWASPLLFYVTHELPRPNLAPEALEPGGAACCKPESVPLASWMFNHAPPGLWPAVGHALLGISIVALALLVVCRRQESNDAAYGPS